MILKVVIKPKEYILTLQKLYYFYNRYNGDIVGAWPLSI